MDLKVGGSGCGGLQVSFPQRWVFIHWLSGPFGTLPSALRGWLIDVGVENSLVMFLLLIIPNLGTGVPSSLQPSKSP